jgi:hypothetical protein
MGKKNFLQTIGIKGIKRRRILRRFQNYQLTVVDAHKKLSQKGVNLGPLRFSVTIPVILKFTL